jgi:hypothetical protein
MLYEQLKNTLQPQDVPDWKQELADYQALIPAGIAAVHAQQAGQKYDQTIFNAFANDLQQFDDMSQLDAPLVVPPRKNPTGNWQRVGTALLERREGRKNQPGHAGLRQHGRRLQKGDVAAFNAALADYRASLVPQFFPRIAQGPLRGVLQPDAAVLCRDGHLRHRRAPRRLLLVQFVGNAAALRRLADRPGLRHSHDRPDLPHGARGPSARDQSLFLGHLHRLGRGRSGTDPGKIHRNGIGAVAAAGMGFITLVIAQNLAVDGDTMEMMRAVLDTNFWLATHVVAVTTGYASTFVAGFLALIYILRGVFTKTLDEATGKSLARMVYGIVCFATLFSFVGTVLGGIWADQSWGRFWGWDPKENGALIIVLWNAMILHMRWGGMIRERGLIVCAIGGNIVTSWSWFGVNMLGIGLHSYGFTDAAFKWLSLFVASQIFTEFKDRVGDIISGTVRRFERSDVILDLGKYEALLPNRERVPTEEYQVGERIRCYVKAVEEGPHGPEIILSRADPQFIIKLFQLEVSEINDGTIEIKGIAREPGFRTKMAVYSRDPKVDPVGACVGMRGQRVKNIVRELNNEKVDVIPWSAGRQNFCHEGARTGAIEKHRN